MIGSCFELSAKSARAHDQRRGLASLPWNARANPPTDQLRAGWRRSGLSGRLAQGPLSTCGSSRPRACRLSLDPRASSRTRRMVRPLSGWTSPEEQVNGQLSSHQVWAAAADEQSNLCRVCRRGATRTGACLYPHRQPQPEEAQVRPRIAAVGDVLQGGIPVDQLPVTSDKPDASCGSLLRK